MNRKLFGALAIAILALAVNVNAQSRAKANIPFSFSLGEAALPAGTYVVEGMSNGANGLIVRNQETSKGVLILTQSAERRQSQQPKLVFHKYGDSYFLCEVWTGSKIGMEIPESRHEKEVKMASTDGAAPQEVVVALR